MASQAKSLRISNIQIEVRRWGAYEGKACNIVTKGFGDQTEFSVGTLCLATGPRSWLTFSATTWMN
jgi:hypothetical protein